MSSPVIPQPADDGVRGSGVGIPFQDFISCPVCEPEVLSIHRVMCVSCLSGSSLASIVLRHGAQGGKE